MSLQSALFDRLRPWYLLDTAAFLFGAGGSIWRASLRVDRLTDLSLLAITDTSPPATVTTVVSGLLTVGVVHVTVGNLWGYAAEYANAGGQWSDLPFLVSVGGGFAAVAAAYAMTGSLATAAWAGFWTFVIVAGAVAVAVSFAAGYQESSS